MRDAPLLALAYRGRPRTVHELAALSHRDVADVEGAVRRLRERGQLGGQGDVLAYVHPADWASETVAATAAGLRSTATGLLDEIEHIIEALPRMLGHWTVGESSHEPMPVAVRHGPRAVEDTWLEVGHRDGGALKAVLPDISRFLTSSPERVQRMTEAFHRKQHVQVVLSTCVIDDPATRHLLDVFTKANIVYRFIDDPPSWFWVDDDQIAVPYVWGESKPTSVVSVRNAALGGLMSAYFEELWRRATPETPTVHPWTPLLHLMRGGMTLETASRTIGINPRTGRRRIAQAMEHYGVSTLFALGTAWGADFH